MFFSISSSATTVYNDIDKIMLSKLSDLASTGVYAAAYRVIDVSMTPVRSLVSAAYPRVFSEGCGRHACDLPVRTFTDREGRNLRCLDVRRTMDIAPRFCRTFSGSRAMRLSVPALRWLALIPFLRCFHVLSSRDALSGAGIPASSHGHPGVCGVEQYVGLNFANSAALLAGAEPRGRAWVAMDCW